MDNNVYRDFIKSMNKVLQENGKTLNDAITQQELLEELFDIEESFRETLIEIPEGRKMYAKFMDFIFEVKGNTLSSRVYFREKQNTFTNKISPAFKKKSPAALHVFRVNYQFMKWIMDRYKGPKQRRLSFLFKSAIKLRKRICEDNLPLAINRAKIFWSKVPDSHLEYMDIVQTSAEGLITAIDKFVPPYLPVFKGVAIGRMTLNMLTDHNATSVKLSPNDKRILYRANNAKSKEGFTEIEDILVYVRQSFKNVTRKKLEMVMSAGTYTLSIDGTNPDNEDGPTLEAAFNVDNIDADHLTAKIPNPEETSVSEDLKKQTIQLMKDLSILEEKIIRLKMGINYEF